MSKKLKKSTAFLAAFLVGATPILSYPISVVYAETHEVEYPIAGVLYEGGYPKTVEDYDELLFETIPAFGVRHDSSSSPDEVVHLDESQYYGLKVETDEGTFTFVKFSKNDFPAKELYDGDVYTVWRFTPNAATYTVDYAFVSATSEPIPEEVNALKPKDSNTYSDGASVTALQPAQTSVQISNGTWTFNGYDENTKTVQNTNVVFTGTWTFTPKEVEPETAYGVTYEFVDENGGTLPDAVLRELPTDSNTYTSGTKVTAEDPYDTDVYTPQGYWMFRGYDENEKTVQDSNITFTGKWYFEPKKHEGALSPVYTFESVTKDKEFPGFWNYLPVDPNSYNVGEIATPVMPRVTSVKVEDGTWQFIGFDKDEMAATNNDFLFTGLWKFMAEDAQTYHVNYIFESATQDKELPAEVEALKPDDDQTYENGAEVNAKELTTTSVKVDDGTWSFTGYKNDKEIVKGNDVEFVGTWVFTPKTTEEPSTQSETKNNANSKDSTQKIDVKKQDEKTKKVKTSAGVLSELWMSVSAVSLAGIAVLRRKKK